MTFSVNVEDNSINIDDKKLTKVLSTKLSIQDHNICKLIAGQLFKERIVEEPTTSALIRALLSFAIKDFKDRNMQNLQVILG
jgi:threonine dehydratase